MAGVSALEQAVHKAIALHQAGKLDAAKAAYEAILRNHPRDANVLMNLSTLHIKRGQHAEAEKLLKRLIMYHPKLPQPHFGYGNVLLGLGRFEEALASFDRALSLAPNDADTYYNRGMALDRLKRYEESLVSFDRALALNPAHINAFSHRIATLNALGRHAEALAAAQDARVQELEGAWLFRAIALQELGRLDEAFNYYGRAIAANPNHAENYSHRANGYNKKHDYVPALADIDRAMALGDQSGFAHNIRAVALNALSRYEEAVLHYEKAVALDPNIDTAYWNVALIKLMLGDYASGLPLYEWRWKVPPQNAKKRDLSMPLWLGEESLEGKRIFVHPEQGLGDFIQCARYLPLLMARGVQVLLETPAPLLQFFRDNFAGKAVAILPEKQPVPEADFHCPVMSLPLALGITLETIPNQVPYLRASPEKLAEWQQKLGAKTVSRVGLVWSGGPMHVYDFRRSIPLEMLQPMLQQSMQQNIEFHCLQKEIRESDTTHLNGIRSHADSLNDFTDTAALIELMDVVVTVDTSVAHLAGALGKPTWIFLSLVPDYRWLLDRADSPLYPTARLFRQNIAGDWQGPIARVADALKSIG